MARSYPRFLGWVDLETTGLPVKNDFKDVHLLEAAVIITDFNLNPLAGYTEVVAMTSAAATEIRSNPFVKEMHTKSGLLRDSVASAQSGQGKTMAVVEREITTMFSEHGDPEEFMIAGSGVAAFDHPMIKQKMPDLAVWFAYYPFDIGVMRRTVKILAGKEVVSHTSASYGDAKTHRALDDVKAHLEEAGKYREWVQSVTG